MERINNSVYLKIPSLEDLKYTEILLNDTDTMRFNEKWGGTVAFPKQKWQSFHEEYINQDHRVYFHIYNLDHIFVGEVSTRFDHSFDSYILNIKIMDRFRGNHHASDALEIFLDYVFLHMNADRICDNVDPENQGAIRLLKSFGFQEVDRQEDYLLLELKKE